MLHGKNVKKGTQHELEGSFPHQGQLFKLEVFEVCGKLFLIYINDLPDGKCQCKILFKPDPKKTTQGVIFSQKKEKKE